MQYFLSKTEPESYSIKQLQSDSKTVWDGVRNAQALKTIRSMRLHDRIFIYHSGGQSAIVGLASAASNPRTDPQDEKLTVIDYQFLALFANPVSLHEIKETHLFDDWSLVRQSRLATMPVPDSFLQWIRARLPGESI